MSDVEHDPDENPDAEPVEPIEPDDDDAGQTPEQAAQTEGSREVARKLERETDRHFKAVSKILDADMSDKVCPTCDGFGFADDEQKAKAASELPPDFVHPDNYVTCDGCNGYGEIVSGSKNPAHQIVICTKCNALGYRIEAQRAPQENVYAMPAPVPDGPVGGQWVPGRGFIPYGATEPIPGTG